MVAAILAIITAIISYFGSKKAGASDGQAALVAAGAGAGAYYVATDTEWGKGVVSQISEWVGLKDPNGQVLLDANGQPTKAPEGATPVMGADGQPARDPNGNIIWKLVDSAGNVLQSWGPTGTAAVIGAGALASTADDFPWLWVGAGGIALLALTS